MSKAEQATANADDWDARKLGHDEEFVKPAPASREHSLDEALGLQPISIRLQKQLIEDLKFIATAHGIGYQPLIRDVLCRFVAHEKKLIIREVIERTELEQRQKEQEAKNAAPASTERKVA